MHFESAPMQSQRGLVEGRVQCERNLTVRGAREHASSLSSPWTLCRTTQHTHTLNAHHTAFQHLMAAEEEKIDIEKWLIKKMANTAAIIAGMTIFIH